MLGFTLTIGTIDIIKCLRTRPLVWAITSIFASECYFLINSKVAKHRICLSRRIKIWFLTTKKNCIYLGSACTKDFEAWLNKGESFNVTPNRAVTLTWVWMESLISNKFFGSGNQIPKVINWVMTKIHTSKPFVF